MTTYPNSTAQVNRLQTQEYAFVHSVPGDENPRAAVAANSGLKERKQRQYPDPPSRRSSMPPGETWEEDVLYKNRVLTVRRGVSPAEQETPMQEDDSGVAEESSSLENPYDIAIRACWRLHAQGLWTQDQAEAEVSRLQRERDQGKRDEADRQRALRVARKRKWAGCGIVPHWIREHLTTGESAVAATVLHQIKRQGVCHLFNAAIACICGVSTKTVQRAIRKLERFGVNVRRGWFNGVKNTPTKITTTCSKIYQWICRNAASGQISPSSKIIESYSWRPAQPKAAPRTDYRPIVPG